MIKKRVEKILVLAGILLMVAGIACAQDSPSKPMVEDPGASWYPEGYPQGTFSTDCELECQPHQTMKNMIEGRVAYVNCVQSCQQRKVWEKLAVSIADVADALKKNSYKEVMVPIEMKLDDLKAKVSSLEQKVDSLKTAEKEAATAK